MTIDDAIKMYKKIENTDANCPRYCMRPCGECVQECRQVAGWLEELKMLRLDSYMIHLPERLQLVETGYNKAIDDFVRIAKEYEYCDITNNSFRFIEFLAEQLKAGGENEK